MSVLEQFLKKGQKASQAVRDVLISRGFVEDASGNWSKPKKGDVIPSPPGTLRTVIATGKVEAPKKRLRQSSKPKMNKLEAEFYEKLKMDYDGYDIQCQSVRLELATSHWYKPDFFIPAGHIRHADPHQCIAYEVKGPHSFRGGFENLKVAARAHKWCKFYLVWKENGVWKRQEILP